MKRTNGFQLERAPAGGQTLPPWAAALCGGLCAAGALTLLAGSFPVLPAWAALLLGLLTALFRVVGKTPEGVSYAIILGNIAAPLLERLTLPKPFGSQEAIR